MLMGSGRDVFSPSESSTIADEPKNPMSTSPPSLSSADSSICRGLPAIVLSEVKRPWPSDVPPLAESRRIAATTSSFTSVGRSTVRALSPNATMPTRIVLGCRSANAVAAAFAALDASGLEIVRPHAVGHVEGEDHRALSLR